MKHRKSILAICLIAVLCLSLLAGCGGKPDDTKGSGTKTDPGGSGTNPSAAPTQDTYVYTAQYVPIRGEDLGYVSTLYACDGRLLTSAYGVVGNDTPEGVTPEYEGQYDVYGNIFYWIDLDGTAHKLEKYEQLDIGVTDENKTVTSYSMGFDVAPDGTLRNLETVYISWYDGPDDVEMYSDEWYS